jgi:hypothetical protein
MTLEALLRETAQRGELSDFSVYFSASSKKFIATFVNAAEAGKQHRVEHKNDPIIACIEALQQGRRRKLTGAKDATPVKPDAKRGGGKSYTAEVEDFG